MEARAIAAAVVRVVFASILTVLGVATVADAAELTASWTDNSGGTAAFALERRTSTDASFTPLTDVPIGITSYVDTSVAQGVTYCYRVRAYNDTDQSPYSDEACGSVSSTDYSVSVTKSGDGAGLVTSIPAGISCGSGCRVTYPAGTVVTLVASATSGSKFAGWTGDCSGTSACRVVGNAGLNVEARFNLLPSTSSTSGASSSSGASSTTGAAAAGGASIAVSTSTPMTAAASSIAAAPANQASAPGAGRSGSVYDVVVAKSGDGTGTVSSNPGGIECGNGCSMTYMAGIPVTLTATPEAGSRFEGWSGQCSGKGACTVSGNGAISVTARFTRLSPGEITGPATPLYTFDPDRPGSRRRDATPLEGATSTGPRTAVAPANPPRAWMAAVQTTTTGLASPYRLMVRTARRTWIRVRMDNGQMYEEKLKAGAVRVWVSDQPFAITLRDTGGVRFELNGRRLPVPEGVPISNLVLPRPLGPTP